MIPKPIALSIEEVGISFSDIRLYQSFVTVSGKVYVKTSEDTAIDLEYEVIQDFGPRDYQCFTGKMINLSRLHEHVIPAKFYGD